MKKIKAFIKCLLWDLSWWVLDDHIRTGYIHRSHFSEYTRWMSRDFPVMEDMHEYFKDKPYGQGVGHIDRHRDYMKAKYIDKATDNF